MPSVAAAAVKACESRTPLGISRDATADLVEVLEAQIDQAGGVSTQCRTAPWGPHDTSRTSLEGKVNSQNGIILPYFYRAWAGPKIIGTYR